MIKERESLSYVPEIYTLEEVLEQLREEVSREAADWILPHVDLYSLLEDWINRDLISVIWVKRRRGRRFEECFPVFYYYI